MDRQRMKFGLVLFTVGLMLIVILVVLQLSGIIGSNQRGTMEQRLQTIASQLHAPGDTTTQTVVSSNVPAAWTIRRQIAVMLNQGLSNEKILSTLQTDYGPTVLANPPNQGFGAWAWVLPIAGAVGAIVAGVFFAYKKSRNKPHGMAIAEVGESESPLLKDQEWRQYL